MADRFTPGAVRKIRGESGGVQFTEGKAIKRVEMGAA